MSPLARRLLALGLLAAAGTASPAVAAPPDEFPARLAAYEAELGRPSLQKRTLGRRTFARTKDPRARDVLAASYRRAEEPTDHVRYSIVSIVVANFKEAGDLPAFAAWRAANGKAEDAWLWYRTLDVDRAVAGTATALATALAPGDPCLRAAALAAASGDDPAILAAISTLAAVPGKDPFERALLAEACADALSKQAAQVGKAPFHDPATRVIKSLDDPATPPRSRLVVARRLAKTFGKPHAVLDAKYWHRVLLAAEGAAQEAAEADDRYAPPKPPTFAGVPATGKRIVYLIDLSDSMMAPVSVKEVTELKKPRGETTPGDDAGKPAPPPAEPKPDEAPPRDPMADVAVDWTKVNTRFDAAREMLKASLKALDEDVSYAVVFFGTKAELAKTTPGMTPALPAAVRRTAAELDAIKPGRPQPKRPLGTLLGHTNVHGAFRIAYKLKETGTAGPYEYVRADTFFQGCDTIFLLSDGDPSYSDWPMSDRRDPDDHGGDPESKAKGLDTPNLIFHGPYSQEAWILDDLRRMNLLRRVEIHAVGIGEVSGRFLKNVAAVGGGRVRRIAPEGKKPEEKK